MCGRYTLYELDKLGDRFHIDQADIAEIEDDLRERYNIGPSQVEPTIIEHDNRRRIELMRWGFMPPWAKDTKSIFKYRTFNARSEDIFEKRTWRSAIRHSRCLVPSNGFYEWQATPSGKQPYFIRPKDHELFAFAGIYGRWQDRDGIEYGTYSIVTTTPSQDLAPIHDRMPVILHSKDEDRWLDPSNNSPESIADLLRPYDDGQLEVQEVSKDVNTTRIDEAHLVTPINAA